MRLREYLPGGARLLIVTAVEAERAAILRGLDLTDDLAADRSDALQSGERYVVRAAGVGVAAAAADTAWCLATAEALGLPFACAVSAGIAGGFGRTGPGDIVLGSRSIAADLGAESADGFLPLERLGFGSSTVEAHGGVLSALTEAIPAATVGDILTVSTVTGTAKGAAALVRRHPTAVAEAMEGFGVATAAQLAGVPFAEIRTISNPVGPRDRSLWRLDDALAALAVAAAALAAPPAIMA